MNKSEKPLVGIIMGSDSDLLVMSEAAKFLEEMEISYEMTVISAHRTPERMMKYGTTARARGLKVIISGAGLAAHLPGVAAAYTTLPIIGVPLKSSTSVEWDSILSILQMPSGVPVATVALNAAKNAGILAAQIIGAFDSGVAGKLAKFKEELKVKVQAVAEKLEKEGWKKYLGK
ncbi:MAG: 5-(carboxyamino)imidazole ribonucleotide mutase [Candidatus Gracilibacteria bacterium]|jgi:5-(carboxyamino)imidazole ribonucleotide mutase